MIRLLVGVGRSTALDASHPGLQLAEEGLDDCRNTLRLGRVGVVLRFGCRIQGPPDGPPLVLLPGDSETSLAWIPVIEAFASEHHVCALDHIYDIGRSIYRTQPRRPGDFVRWLDELLDELNVHDVRLVGHSYGGWIASLYALEFPERLNKLVLLSPPTVLRPPLG